MTTPRTRGFWILLTAAMLVVLSPLAASAQSELDTAQAQAFLGNWTLNLDAQGQPFPMSLAVTDADGKVAVTLSNDFQGAQEITNVARSGANLVLRYEIDAQGQSAPVAVTLAPNGERLNVTMDFADGMFVMSGTGTKNPME